MKRKVTEKLQAIALRKEGGTVNEIATCLHVSKGSVSAWVRNVQLSTRGKIELQNKVTTGQLAGAKSKREHTRLMENKHFETAYQTIGALPLTRHHIRLLCALIYWCEGAKGTGRVEFTNADPNLVQLFLKYFRSGFILDEQKFRVCIHLHTYHDTDNQIAFWSGITNIPKVQFIKPQQKSHTEIQIRENYQGCISIRYHSADTTRELHAIAKAAFAQNN